MSDTDDLDQLRAEKRKELLQDDEDTGTATADEPIHVEGTDHLAELVADHDVVLGDFYADWCAPCKAIEPIVAEIAEETDAAVAKVDVDRNQQLAAEYGVRGVPTLVLFSGGEMAEKMVGLKDRGRLFDVVRNATGE